MLWRIRSQNGKLDTIDKSDALLDTSYYVIHTMVQKDGNGHGCGNEHGNTVSAWCSYHIAKFQSKPWIISWNGLNLPLWYG